MNLRELLAKASPARSGDELAGMAAATAEERVRAQMKLADVPLKSFLASRSIPYEDDEVTRLICDSHDAAAFAPVSHLTVGEFRDWLLSEQATTERAVRAGAGADSGDGGGGFEDHAAAGPGAVGGEMPRGDAVPVHHRTCGADFDAAAAEPSDRRPARASRRASSTGCLTGAAMP